jgi:hypothetical protein
MVLLAAQVSPVDVVCGVDGIAGIAHDGRAPQAREWAGSSPAAGQKKSRRIMLKFTSYASSSSGNLYTLSDGHTDLLIECGVSWRDLAWLPKSPSEYDACIYSHEHGDHCNAKTAAELRRRGVPMISGYPLYSDTWKQGTVLIRSFEVKHDVPNHGYIFRGACSETCVFVIDTFFCPVVPKFSPTIVAIEANYAKDLLLPGDILSDRLYGSHMEIGQCIKTLQSWDLSKTREIHLLHLSDSRSDEARFIREVREATGIPTYAAPQRGWK